MFNFKNEYAVKVAREILVDNVDFIHTVISPKDKKTYQFSNKNIMDRFFADSRKELLQEV